MRSGGNCSFELHYDDGRVDRRLFGVSADDGHELVRLGADMMWKKK